MRLGVGALRLGQPGPDAVAGQRAADEDDVAVRAGDAAPALGERVDLELELARRLRGLVGAGRHASIVAAWPRISTSTHIAREAEAFLERIEREYYLHWRGPQVRARDRARSTTAYEGLFSADRVAALRELRLVRIG